MNPVKTPNVGVTIGASPIWTTQNQSAPESTEHQKSVTMLPPVVASESRKSCQFLIAFVSNVPSQGFGFVTD